MLNINECPTDVRINILCAQIFSCKVLYVDVGDFRHTVPLRLTLPRLVKLFPKMEYTDEP